MDKIPAALQHKIDYIKALDIPAEQKASRIAIAIIDYHNRDVSMAKWYLNDIASLIAGANIDDAESQVKRVNTHILTLNGLLEMGVNKEVLGSKQKYMFTGKAVKEIMDDVINDDKGLSPASSGTPMPKVKPAKTSVNGDGCGGLPSKSGGEGGCGPDADSLGPVLGSKQKYSFNATLKEVQDCLISDGKGLPPKREQPSGWYLAGCFFCVFLLSASLGVILERSL